MTTSHRPNLLHFFLWSVAGVAVFLSILAVLTIGIFVLAVAALLILGLLLWPKTRNISAVGLAAGFGEIAVFVAYLNRGGPGDVCTRHAADGICTADGTEWSPWPWLIIGLTLVLGSVALFLHLRRSQRSN